jgi:hypothetical protein
MVYHYALRLLELVITHIHEIPKVVVKWLTFLLLHIRKAPGLILSPGDWLSLLRVFVVCSPSLQMNARIVH